MGTPGYVKLLLPPRQSRGASLGRLEDATGQGWSLSRLLERVLRVPARVLLHARKAMIVIPARTAKPWHQLCRALRACE